MYFYTANFPARVHLTIFFLIGRMFSSTRLGPISSTVPLPVSRGRHGKLVDNFSPNQTSHPYRTSSRDDPKKTPFYFTIVFHINGEETLSLNSRPKFSRSFRLLISALEVYATAFGPMFPCRQRLISTLPWGPGPKNF